MRLHGGKNVTNHPKFCGTVLTFHVRSRVPHRCCRDSSMSWICSNCPVENFCITQRMHNSMSFAEEHEVRSSCKQKAMLWWLSVATKGFRHFSWTSAWTAATFTGTLSSKKKCFEQHVGSWSASRGRNYKETTNLFGRYHENWFSCRYVSICGQSATTGADQATSDITHMQMFPPKDARMQAFETAYQHAANNFGIQGPPVWLRRSPLAVLY